MKKAMVIFTLFFTGMMSNLSFSQGVSKLNTKFDYPTRFNIDNQANKLTLPKKTFNYHILDGISPEVGYKYGGDFMINGDLARVHSIELGVSFTRGEINDWVSWGPLPLGWDWNYFSLPYITLEYRFLNRVYQSELMVENPQKFNPVMLNIGVSGGIGAVLLIVPFGINGSVGLSTDFSQLYGRFRVGYDIIGFSFGYGMYYSFTKKPTDIYNPNYSFIEVSYRLVRTN